jgi:hypothetical protein
MCCLHCSQVVGGAIDNDFIHLWPCAMLTAGAMLAFKCLSADQARSAIEWEVYICIAFAFAVRCGSFQARCTCCRSAANQPLIRAYSAAV